MKNLFAALIAAFLCLSTAFCPAIAEDETYLVGICQLAQHAALDEATRGFKDSLTEKLGDRVSFDEQNASGDSAVCISIVNAFIAEEVDLIVANSTQALQTAWSATGDIPILGVSVTDYPAALDMDDWNGITGVNVSGTSDLAPLDTQAELIHELFPEAKEIGLLYCSSEANSIYQAEEIAQHLAALGYHCTDYTFTDTNDVFSVTQNACQNCDVLFVPTDNTVASCTEVILNVVEMEGTPIIGGDEGICSGCGIATVCINYYDLGYATGAMACEILINGADISAMPVEFAPSVSKIYNPELCEMLNITVPEGYTAIGE